MRKRIKILSLNRRRDLADEIETTEATAYFAGITADLEAHRDEPLGADVEEAAASPWTAADYPWPVDPAEETQQIPAVPAGAAYAMTERLPAVPAPQPDIRQRPPVPVAGPSWTEQDAQLRGEQAAELAAAAIEEPIVEQVPAPRRRHLPVVGAWFAEHLKPVPRPAIPDAGNYRVVDLAEFAAAEPETAPTTPPAIPAGTSDSGRLVLEAAATTELVDEHPDDFVEWLRLEFAAIDRRYDAALAEHAQAAVTDHAHFAGAYFRDAQHTFDQLNAMTLPGWTDLETALYNTGVFA